jgi:hypothetical protein
MRRSPPLAPGAPLHDATAYIVIDDFGDLGRAYRETDEADADERTIIDDILCGQFSRPVRVVAFNTAEQWSRDASADIARSVAERARNERRRLSEGTRQFLEDYLEEAEIPAATT